MGVDKKTVQNLQVVELNQEQGYMLIKGSVPGAKNGFVRIAKALKK
jgi:large subunit ribosomal protein L3